jgi:hypothetical protein
MTRFFKNHWPMVVMILALWSPMLVSLANEYYTHGSFPATGSQATSAAMRAEFDAVTTGFDKLATLTGNANEIVTVNAGANALTSTATPASNGLVFPATQVNAAGANTFDDYEEGTWTPSVGGTATYGTQLGHYTKVGNVVTISGVVGITLIGTGSTSVISGLPFAPKTETNLTVTVSFAGLATANIVNVVGLTLPNISTITLAGYVQDGTTTAAILGNTSTIRFSASYLTS